MRIFQIKHFVTTKNCILLKLVVVFEPLISSIQISSGNKLDIKHLKKLTTPNSVPKM